jgi:hypothetical protein
MKQVPVKHQTAFNRSLGAGNGEVNDIEIQSDMNENRRYERDKPSRTIYTYKNISIESDFTFVVQLKLRIIGNLALACAST